MDGWHLIPNKRKMEIWEYGNANDDLLVIRIQRKGKDAAWTVKAWPNFFEHDLETTDLELAKAEAIEGVFALAEAILEDLKEGLKIARKIIVPEGDVTEAWETAIGSHEAAHQATE